MYWERLYIACTLHPILVKFRILDLKLLNEFNLGSYWPNVNPTLFEVENESHWFLKNSLLCKISIEPKYTFHEDVRFVVTTFFGMLNTWQNVKNCYFGLEVLWIVFQQCHLWLQCNWTDYSYVSLSVKENIWL
jgi:hypothetical protein